MFLAETLAIGEQAMKQVFVPGYVSLDGQSDFSNLHISIEYPTDKQNYPAIWVDFEPDHEITRSGIDNIDTLDPNPDGTYTPYYLWRAQGDLTYTICAMSNLERARLHDEVVRVLAFNGDPAVSAYRQFIEDNPLIAMNANFDNIQERPPSISSTPWDSLDLIYEITVAVTCVIEFQAAQQYGALVPFYGAIVTGTDPTGYGIRYQNIEGTVNTERGFDLPNVE